MRTRPPRRLVSGLAIGCAVIAFGASGSPAGAAPLGTASDDVDGDGKLDELELDSDGTLRVGGVKRGTFRLPAGATKVRILVARGQLVLDVTATTTTTTTAIKTTPIMTTAIMTTAIREAIVVDVRGWRELARFPLGGIGSDREYGMEVEVTAAGIVRYQTRWDVRRCDGKPAYLFAERLDPQRATFQPLPTPPIEVPPSAPLLRAKVDAVAAAAPLLYQARAASHQPGASDAGALAIPRELDDGRNDTQWREDIASTAGEGQFFTFLPRAEAAQATQLRIVPGNPTSAATIKTFNRPRVLAVVSARGAWRVELPDAASDPLGVAYVADLPQPITGCVTIIIESTYGKPQGTTAIAELGVYAEGERTGGGEALLARLVAGGQSGSATAAAALARRGAAAAVAIEAELAKTTDAATRRRLVAALAKITDPAAGPALVRAATAGWVKDKDLIDVIAALAVTNQIPALRDLASSGGLPLEIRLAAVTRITPVGPGFDALVELAGKGPRPLRQAVIERLALAPGAALATAAAAQPSPAVSGDLWRALTRRVRGHADERPAAVAAMTAELATATDYDRRYRLVEGIAAYGDAAAIAALEKLLRELPRAATSSALRQVAVNGIASSPRGEAVGLVIALARNADPGVRLAALSALAGTETDSAGPWHASGGPDGIDRILVNGLATDTWPEVRRRAANALGTRCKRPGPATALAIAVAKDPALDVRGDALASLVQCEAAGIRELLPSTWNNGKAPLELRERAVDLAVTLGDQRLGVALVGKFRAWQGEALTSAPALRLAQSAAAAIGRLRAPGAAAALEEALDDSAFPEIVSAAALGLGALGPACPPSARAKLVIIARSGSQSAAAAKRAAAQCGR